MNEQSIEVTLEELGVPYVIGGSLASALHGVARSTLDCCCTVDRRFVPQHSCCAVSSDHTHRRNHAIKVNLGQPFAFTGNHHPTTQVEHLGRAATIQIKRVNRAGVT